MNHRGRRAAALAAAASAVAAGSIAGAEPAAAHASSVAITGASCTWSSGHTIIVAYSNGDATTRCEYRTSNGGGATFSLGGSSRSDLSRPATSIRVCRLTNPVRCSGWVKT